ncbi:hypothetical protein SAMN04488134_102203 [Amphibacillus marinus]|uniref:Uncharacterized protein n=1 Tax=Amphibacillus marinus TaxID=872970 RepID=A0A1H8K8M5_9BACI|nr:hypothetical protein [Amphibacillus marinus]SEN89051.1 hypothetical protein SAMN04488134_102203 [Amphibacillus marinus]
MAETDEKELNQLGALIIAFGTTISSAAETINLAEDQFDNDLLSIIGDGFQAFGAFLLGVTTFPDWLSFFGNWADGIGAATAAVGVALNRYDVIEDEEGTRLIILGDSLQTIGAGMATLSNYELEAYDFMVGNAAQSFGAGLKAVGAVVVESDSLQVGQFIVTAGTIIQALGANYVAGLELRE